MQELQKAWIYLENGDFYEARSFGASGSYVGEIVFNTSLSGYQEISSDPSYAGQFVCLTMPEIGIVGANNQDMECVKIYAKGIICRNYNEFFSNFRADFSFGEFLRANNCMGICGIDTRKLTKSIRTNGSMMMIASSEISSKDELKEMLSKSKRIEDINYIEEVSTKEAYNYYFGKFDFNTMAYETPNTSKKIVAIDFGIKRSILQQLVNAGFSVSVVPNTTKASKLIEGYKNSEFDAIFLSNGPGDPQVLSSEVAEISSLIEAKIPIFAICLGHQLISLAMGYPTYKLPFGHHGGNHPVKNTLTNKIEITAQNHNYSVPDDIVKIADITHVNLFDNTIEGLKYKDYPIYSLQHHPEAGPGPLESTAIFREFAEFINSVKCSK
ncbi:glutamine-hydrolyzing carbamoyl-phosphate synthase small subunit [Helicobacter ibis]|uniref:Carbamoyl phosphate synthase small chain n=1 Tax=Helicobacter ibis TaxID=2962633 RepID=A0ABT4VEX9_9HELI|nr:glutamine-hydrolyzing carbamoyl-phosphate synthase small subunit [Helicobacter ibis]MDA3969272.1 glutamine-hydrolyzing carbamoyl-phosphate synthase small subunit [Helicobacter ibis]